MYKLYILFSMINLLICLITCSNRNQHIAESSTKDDSPNDDTDTIAFDPTFGQNTLDPMQAGGLPFLDPRKSGISIFFNV